jgi:Ca2+:H+ antiporter
MADTLSSLMIITATALILPTALYSRIKLSEPTDSTSKILDFSRGSAVVLIVLYVMYLYFQLWTHPTLFQDENNIDDERTGAEEEEVAPFSLPVARAIAVLIIATLGIIFCARLLLDSAKGTAQDTPFTKTFIAAILIPIASNAPEATTIMTHAGGGKVNFGIGVIVDSILQIALFVLPFLVLLGWMIDQPMSLRFNLFQTTMLFLSVLVVNRLLQDGKYTYVQGGMLVAL